MKVINISYPTPLSEIEDIENDNVDVFVELEDGVTYTVVISTPKNLFVQMDSEGSHYIPASPPHIIVRTLTHDNIRNAIESFAKEDAYWLKLYYLAGERYGIFNITSMDDTIRLINESNDATTDD
jgi:phosphatidate phosphatase APP1